MVHAEYEPKATVEQVSMDSVEPLQRTYEHLLGGNDYTPGNCTWGVANWTPVIAGLGNASSWDDRAQALGVPISDVPRVGAVGQRDGGLGHVVFVKAIDGDMVLISEMNSIGFGVVDEKWVSASTYRYIYF